MSGTDFYDDWVYRVGPDTLLVAGHRLNRTTDGGATWTELEPQGRFNDLDEVPPGLPHAGRLIAAVDVGIARFSDDRGATWTLSADPPDTAPDADELAVVAAGPHAGRVVGAGLSGLIVSDDGGATWAPTTEWAYFQQAAGCVVALRGQAPGGGDRLVTVINDIRVPDDSVRVTVSDDGGDTWRRVQPVDPGAFRTCIGAVDLGGGRAAVAMMRGPVYGTEDGGETWRMWSPLPQMDAAGGDRARWLWVGPEGHLWVGVILASRPRWVVRSTVPVAAFAVAAGEGPEAEGPGLRVWPNPADGRVTVEGAGAGPASVRVSVTDGLGREVAVLHDGPAAAGLRLTVETAGWPAGVYHVRAVAETGATRTAPFTLVR